MVLLACLASSNHEKQRPGALGSKYANTGSKYFGLDSLRTLNPKPYTYFELFGAPGS